MSNLDGTRHDDHSRGTRHLPDETKAAFKTTEFWVFLIVTLGIVIAAAAIDENEDGQGFGAAAAAGAIAIVAAGYMISRGLAKAGTRSWSNDSH